MLDSILDTPWSNPVREEEPHVAIPATSEAQSAPAPPEDRRPVPRRVFITDATLREFGFTSNCRRCRRIQLKLPAQGIPHHEECRRRLEQAMRDRGDARVKAADERILRELERRGGHRPGGEEEEGGGNGRTIQATAATATQMRCSQSISAAHALASRSNILP